MSVVCFKVVKEDFDSQGPAAKIKLDQVKELNEVLKGLRSKIKDMSLDPSKLKEDLDNYKRENDLLRAERNDLLARLENKQNELYDPATAAAPNDEDAMDFKDDQYLQPGQHFMDVNVHSQVEVEADHLGVGHQGEPKEESAVQVLRQDQVAGEGQQHAIGFQVEYQQFLLFQQYLKFQSFLSSQREQPIPQVIIEPENKSAKPFITYPDGRVMEIVEISNL